MIKRLHSIFLSSTGVTTDTRTIQQGNIFFALKGPSFNGNDFAEKALSEGCSYAIVDEERTEFKDDSRFIKVEDGLEALQQLARYHRSKLKIPVIGLTGSNGKTTTKELIKAALSQRYSCYATSGNLNNHIGVPLSVLSINKKHEIAVIEMGANHQKEIEFLCTISKPDYGMITNIGLAHLEGFGGEEGVYKGKKELFDHLIAANGTLFVNQDDPKVKRAAGNTPNTGYGSSDSAVYQGDFSIENERLAIRWWRREKPTEKFAIQTNLTGSYNFQNTMAAVAIARYFGVSNKEIKTGLENYQPKNQRSQVEETERDNKVIVDCYNANPSSMKAAIENMNAQSHSHKVVILGDMLELGAETERYHSEVLNQLERSEFQKVILVGEHFAKALSSDNYLSVIETAEAAEHLTAQPIENSLVLLKGSRKKKLETLLELL